jgi:hypothetical protein
LAKESTYTGAKIGLRALRRWIEESGWAPGSEPRQAMEDLAVLLGEPQSG